MGMSPGGAIYVDDDRDMPSESDDEDERLDCVHDIHNQRQTADQNESEHFYLGQGEDGMGEFQDFRDGDMT